MLQSQSGPEAKDLSTRLAKSATTGILASILGGIMYLVLSSFQSYESVELGWGGYMSVDFGVAWVFGSMIAAFALGFLWSFFWSESSDNKP